MSSSAEPWDSSAFITGRWKPGRKPIHSGTGITLRGCTSEAPIAAEVSIPELGRGVLGRKRTLSPFRSESRTDWVAGQKLNFNPTCALSPHLPQPGRRGGTELGEDERLAREKPRVATDWELPAAGADATLAAFEREAGESRARLLGLGSPRSALPFRRRAAPCLLQPRHCAPGRPGVRPARPPSGPRDSSSWTDPRPPAPGQTSFLPGPSAEQADRRLPRRSPLGSGRASLLSAPLQPRAPGA